MRSPDELYLRDCEKRDKNNNKLNYKYESLPSINQKYNYKK